MRPPCEIVTQNFLPLVRGLVAQELINHMTQSEVAEKMGVSQPTISSYLKSLDTIRAEGKEEYLESNTVKLLVNDIVASSINNASPEEIIRKICSSCVNLRISGLTCRKHVKSYPGITAGCQGCLPITDEILIESRKKVITELLEVLSAMERKEDFVKVMPQVLLNICKCLPEPKTIDDIAAFPGRITKIRGKVRALLPPEFGASKHMAQILLTINAYSPSFNSTINIVNNDKVLRIMENLAIKYHTFPNNEFEKLFKEKKTKKAHVILKELIEPIKVGGIFAILNTGGVGIEPITYLFSNSLQALIEITFKIASRL